MNKGIMKSPRFMATFFTVVYFLISILILTISPAISAIFIITIAIVFMVEPWMKFATTTLKLGRWIAVALGLGTIYLLLTLVTIFLFPPVIQEASSFYTTAINFFPAEKNTQFTPVEIELNIENVLKNYKEKQNPSVSDNDINSLKDELMRYMVNNDISSIEELKSKLPLNELTDENFVIILPTEKKEISVSKIAEIISNYKVFSSDATMLAEEIKERTTSFSSSEDWKSAFEWLIDKLNKNLDEQRKVQILTSIRSLLIEIQAKFREYLTAFLEKIPGIVSSMFTVMFFVIIGTIYLSYYFSGFKRHLPGIYPKSSRGVASSFLRDTYGNLERYVVAIILVALLTGISVGIVVKMLGIKYSLLMGVWAAITNLVPIVGVIFEVIPLLLLSLSLKSWVILLVLLAFLATIHVVAFIVFLKLMRGYNRINPVLVIAMIIIMGQLFSVPGAFIAAPLAIILKKFWEHFLSPWLEKA